MDLSYAAKNERVLNHKVALVGVQALGTPRQTPLSIFWLQAATVQKRKSCTLQVRSPYKWSGNADHCFDAAYCVISGCCFVC